jgi:ribosome biogenesis GTPase
MTASGEREARLAGHFAFAPQGQTPVAGDWVAAELPADGTLATIQAVIPRRTAFQRRGPMGETQTVAANLDVALVTVALNGDFNLRRLERYLALAHESGARAIVALTKADLCDDVATRHALASAVAGAAPIFVVSAQTGAGLDALAESFAPGETIALLGSSGVGKSTLVNALTGEARMATQAISGDDKRGRHTTTHRELVRLASGALMLDSPGMRELGLLGGEEGLSATFEDVEALAAACRFSDCRHEREPGCAVRAALDIGGLEEGRWRSFLKLQRELAFERRRDGDPQARAAQRALHTKRQKAYRALKKSRDIDD